MKTRTEWIVAALLMGACGGTERIEGRAASIAPEKALIASAKRAEAEVETDTRARARAAREVVTTAEERTAEEAASSRARERAPKPRPGARAEPEVLEPMPEYRPMLRAMPRWQHTDPHGEEGGW